MLDYDFEKSIGYWVAMTSQALERALSEELAPHGITWRQGQVLGWLALEGGLCQVDLAERMRIEPPTLVSILDRMEQGGWIERRGCVGDRRKKIIAPTAAAEPIWAKVASCARRVRRRAARGLSERDVQRLIHLLGSVQRNLGVEAPLSRRKEAVHG